MAREITLDTQDQPGTPLSREKAHSIREAEAMTPTVAQIASAVTSATSEPVAC
jgi:hypothetical protein